MRRRPDRRARPSPAGAESAFRAALALHEMGLLAEAARLYREALALDRDHLGALYHLGALRIQQRKPREAAALIRRALKQNPRSAAAHNGLGIALEALQRHDAAVASYDRALAIAPNYAKAHSNRGNALQALNRPVEAVISHEAALAARPDYATAHYNLAIALQSLGRLADAVDHYRRAIELRPDHAEAYDNLGSALHALGRHADAIACYKKALTLKPDSASMHNNLGMAYRTVGRAEEAVPHHVKALVIDPGRVEAYNNLGLALHALGRWHEAMDAYAKALSLRPDSAEALHYLGHTLQALARHDEAAASYRAALAIRPSYAEARNDLGNVLQVLRRPAEAIACYEAALAQRPDFADIHNNLGVVLESVGRIEEARQAYERAVALAPGRPAFYRTLVDLAPLPAGDPRLSSLETLAQDMDALSESERIELHFAVGKALADLGEPGRAFDHYLAGNTLKRSRIDYDEGATLRELELIPAMFTAPVLRARQGLGHPSPVPVFIVGMPRSGTTLIEQILASHPQVFGGGEMMELNTAVAGLARSDAIAPRYPEGVAQLSGEGLYRLGAEYLERVCRLAPQAERITDKMPANFRFVGLIHLALPNARIIHVRRDPIDTCLSCFTRLFAHDQPHTYELGELGRYYRAYAAVMAHWRTVLPPGVMLEVEYEALVADTEAETRRMLAHCDLPWDEACLAFYRNGRQVRTASASQVRQPIYRGAIGRWKPYRDRLEPLLRALGVDGQGYPS